MIECYFDGSITCNPGGSATYGAVIKCSGRTVKEIRGNLGEGPLQSVNTAEFGGALEVLKYLIKNKVTEPVTIYGDSQIVVRLLAGQYKAKQTKLYYPYYLQARSLQQQLTCEVDYQWIRREFNEEADALSKPQ